MAEPTKRALLVFPLLNSGLGNSPKMKASEANKAMVMSMLEKANFEAQNIVCLEDSQATLNNIHLALKALSGLTNTQDVLVFYLNTHGSFYEHTEDQGFLVRGSNGSKSVLRWGHLLEICRGSTYFILQTCHGTPSIQLPTIGRFVIISTPTTAVGTGSKEGSHMTRMMKEVCENSMPTIQSLKSGLHQKKTEHNEEKIRKVLDFNFEATNGSFLGFEKCWNKFIQQRYKFKIELSNDSSDSGLFLHPIIPSEGLSTFNQKIMSTEIPDALLRYVKAKLEPESPEASQFVSDLKDKPEFKVALMLALDVSTHTIEDSLKFCYEESTDSLHRTAIRNFRLKISDLKCNIGGDVRKHELYTEFVKEYGSILLESPLNDEQEKEMLRKADICQTFGV